jgi:hypothetical protein
MPQFDDNTDEKFPTVSLLIKTAFKNYEVAITKYEKLLVDNTTLNTLINEKLSKLPDEIKIRETLEKFADEAADRVKYQQDRLDKAEADNTKSTQKLVEDLNKVIEKLLYQFKIVLAWLAIVSVVGTISLTYLKFITANNKSQIPTIQQTVNGKTQKLYIEFLDKDGNKVVIPVPVVPGKDNP